MFIVVLRGAQIHFACKYQMWLRMQLRKCKCMSHALKIVVKVVVQHDLRGQFLGGGGGGLKIHFLAEIEMRSYERPRGDGTSLSHFLWHFCMWLVWLVANCCHSAFPVRQISLPGLSACLCPFCRSNPLRVNLVHVLNSSYALRKIVFGKY